MEGHLQAIDENNEPKMHLVRWVGRGFLVAFAAALVLALVLGQQELRFEGKVTGQIAMALLLAGLALVVWDPVSRRANDLVFKVALVVPGPIVVAGVYWLCGGYLGFSVPASVALAAALGIAAAIPGFAIRKITARHIH